jgi:hypothetical protein
MPLPTVTVLKADGVTEYELPHHNSGQQAAANSASTTLSDENVAQFGATNEAAPANDTAASGLNGRLQRIAQRITSLIALLPSSIGRKAANGSLGTAFCTEDVNLINSLVTEIQGLRTDIATPVVVAPPLQRMFLNSSNPTGTVIPIDMVNVAVTNSTPVTLEAADADEVWAMFSFELSFSAACTLTIEGGTEDFVVNIPSAGIYSLADRPLAYCQTGINGAATITVSAGTCTGQVYYGKGVP